MIGRQWSGQSPFEEVWFVEVLLGPDHGLWVRYVLDAESGHGEIWALAGDRAGKQVAHRVQVPLDSVRGPLFAAGPGRLDRDRCVGEVGPITWDLEFDDRGLRHRHVPLWMRLAPVGRTYAPAVLDLKVRGTVTVNGTVHRVNRGPGVLGHLWGGRSKVKRWAWAHCNAFDREDLIFEALSAEVGPLGTLTSMVLFADGHRYGFSRTRDLFRSWSRFDGEVGTWSFEAKRDGRTLTGHIALDRESSAVVRYAKSDGPDVFCTNTRFGSIRVVLRDPARGLDLDLKSRECAFEIADTTPRSPLVG